jgi:hypothetical protein
MVFATENDTWRVTLISIHPKELVMMPQKDENYHAYGIPLLQVS